MAALLNLMEAGRYTSLFVLFHPKGERNDHDQFGWHLCCTAELDGDSRLTGPISGT
jgi:hypothetical protein